MRNMSFSFTAEQILNQSKTVTRRLGWRFLKVGDWVQPVRKARGLRKGEKIKRLGNPVRIVGVSRERLHSIHYWPIDVDREGFGGHTAGWFVEMFRKLNHCTGDAWVTRIEFEYARREDEN